MWFSQIILNKTIWVAVLAWAIAQAMKIVINAFQNKTIDLKLIYSTGGMPSSHSAFVTSASISIGRIYGFDSGLFALSVIFSLIVMYDSAGVRRAAGTHATAINLLLNINGVTLEEQLKELLGHTPIQVVIGAILGMIIAIFA
ncbi:MAG: divergent PAP2 family protein [Lachnospiraceae bacterium]|nr:divergent PAP2 family protein [Lachnospiraceae bacterium]